MSLLYDMIKVCEGFSRVVQASARFRAVGGSTSSTARAHFKNTQASEPSSPSPSPSHGRDAAQQTAQQTASGNVFINSYQIPFQHSTRQMERQAEEASGVIMQSGAPNKKSKRQETAHEGERGGGGNVGGVGRVERAAVEDPEVEGRKDSVTAKHMKEQKKEKEKEKGNVLKVERGESDAHTFREYSIPSTPLSRMTGFAKLGMQLAYGTGKQWARNKFLKKPSQSGDNDAATVEGQDMEKLRSAEKEEISSMSTVDNREHLGQHAHANTIAKAQPATSKVDGNTSSRRNIRDAVFTDDNADRLAETLCRMRGAALKVGQMLSILDEGLIPKPFLQALDRVRNQADIMPRRQLEQQLNSELGVGWKAKYFKEFDMNPIAAASIGQVHRAVLLDGTEVAVKVQYPGVADSVDSDIKNLLRIIQFTGLMPDGAFINNTMNQARKELKMECDYLIEASNQKRFKQLLNDAGMDEFLVVPEVYEHVSTRRILVTQMIPRGSKTIENLADTAPLEVRNRVARAILDLCLRELFVFRFMQTDPNWSNFYYNSETDKVYLLDFGACLEFPKTFIDEYIRVVNAASTNDKTTVIDASRKMGFLTGEETAVMNDAHAATAMVVGEPFAKPGIYNFEDHTMTKNVTSTIPTMVKHRLTAPPPVSYSLHRKLSGSFLVCFKLNAKFECRSLFVDIAKDYEFDNPEYKMILDDTSVLASESH